jgi:multidrug efflux pump subunit AcrA (membrane-fusion protein)
MFVQVKLTLAHDIQAIVVPRQAVYTVAGLTKLFVVRNGRLVECRVPPGQFLDQWMEVPAGQVQKGDQVVITNIGQLSDGQEVRVKMSSLAELENKG